MLRRVRITLLAATLIVAGSSSAAPARSAAGLPTAVPIARGWDFHTDRGDIGLRRAWATRQPERGWQRVAVPHVFDPDASEAEFDGTVGWYRVRFRAPAARADFDWDLRFDQIRRRARAWLNGREIGGHDDPYVPFLLPTPGLRPGRTNELVLRVDNRRSKALREGWWNWGGIVRPVSLIPRGRLVFRNAGLLPDVSCAPGGLDCRAKVLVEGTLENRSTEAITAPSVQLRLEPPGGGAPIEQARTGRRLKPGQTARIAFEMPVAEPKLWAPGSPYRYAATLTTRADGQATQVEDRKVGLRGVKVRNGLLELNGRKINLHGAAIQEDLPGRGPALDEEDVAAIVRELQAVHANVTRAHYLLNPKLLEALDAAGIMVWSQAPIYHRDALLKTRAQRQAALSTLRRTVFAARSHPSVITHSVANELTARPDGTPGTRRYLSAALAEVRRIDPTLPVSVDLLSYPDYPAAKAYAQYDLLGINSYFGWYPGKKGHSTSELSDLGPFLDRMRRLYPRQAMVLTEFGAEATFAGSRKTKESYAFQADYVARVLDIVRKRPSVGGSIYWTLQEFAVKPDWDGGARRSVPRDGIHNKGLISYAGRRKPAWRVVERAYARTPTFRSDVAAISASNASARNAMMAGGFLLVGALAMVAWWRAGSLRGRRRKAVTSPRY